MFKISYSSDVLYHTSCYPSGFQMFPDFNRDLQWQVQFCFLFVWMSTQWRGTAFFEIQIPDKLYIKCFFITKLIKSHFIYLRSCVKFMFSTFKLLKVRKWKYKPQICVNDISKGNIFQKNVGRHKIIHVTFLLLYSYQLLLK